MSGKLRLNGATSGYSELQAPDVAGDQTFTLPAVGASLVGYQQGFWTPFASVGNITSATGWWTRIGNRIELECSVTGFSNTFDTGPIEIGGAPYARLSSFSSAGSCRTRFVNFSNYLTVGITNTNFCRFYSVDSGDVATALSYSSMVTASKDQAQFMFSYSYLTYDTTWQPINGATIS